MAWPFVFAGAHAPHSDETPDPTATRGSSHSARRLRSLVFLGSPRWCSFVVVNFLSNLYSWFFPTIRAPLRQKMESYASIGWVIAGKYNIFMRLYYDERTISQDCGLLEYNVLSLSGYDFPLLVGDCGNTPC